MNKYTIQENDYNFKIITTMSPKDIMSFKVSDYINNVKQEIIKEYNVEDYILEPTITFSDATKLPKEWHNSIQTGDTVIELQFKKILKEKI